MADDVMRKASGDAQPAPKGATTMPARPESRADRARRLVYRGRFAAFYVLLAMIAGVGVGALIVLVGRGSPAPPPAWSAFEPTGSAERRAIQIGDYVSDPYRLPSGKGLAPVTYAGKPNVTGPDGSVFEVRAVAVEPDTSSGAAESDDIDTFSATNTVMYTLCGLGQACSVSQGQASPERHALLRREALELALYSFKYIEDVDSVIALLPPRPDGQAANAVFLERSDVSAELAKPLNQTLTAPETPAIGRIPAEEQQVIDRVTRSRLYGYTYLQAQDGSPILVLSPALGN